MSNEFQCMPQFALETAFSTWQAQQTQLELTTPEADNRDEHARQVQLCKDKVKLICAELMKLKSNGGHGSTGQEPSSQQGSNQVLNMKLKVLEGAVNQMPTFGTGMEPATFIRDIKNYMPDADCDLSKQFLLKKLRQKLSPEYLTAYTNYVATKSIDTVEEFCEYISSTYESKRSIFQHLEKLDSIAMDDPSMSYRDFAAKVQQEIFDLKTIVRTKFIEVKKKKDASFTGKLTEDDLFSLMAGTLVLRSLKSNHDIFNHTISKIDDCLTGEEIAQIAQSFSERKQTDDPHLQLPGVMYAGKTGQHQAKKNWNKYDNKPKKVDYCHKFQADACKRDPCPYKHEKRPLHEFSDETRKFIVAKKKAKLATKEKEVNMIHAPRHVQMSKVTNVAIGHQMSKDTNFQLDNMSKDTYVQGHQCPRTVAAKDTVFPMDKNVLMAKNVHMDKSVQSAPSVFQNRP